MKRNRRHRDLATYTRPVGAAGVELELYEPRNTAPTQIELRHRVAPGDRLDLLAARYYGDPLAYWRIVDANPALTPDELLEPGRALRIPRSEP